MGLFWKFHLYCLAFTVQHGTIGEKKTHPSHVAVNLVSINFTDKTPRGSIVAKMS